MNTTNDNEAYEIRGIIYTLQENPKKALQDFSKVNYSPSKIDSETYLHKAACFLQLQEYDQATNCLTEGLKYHPDDKNLLKERSNAHKLDGNYKGSIADCTKLLENETDQSEILVLLINRAYCYGKINDYKNAIKDYTKAIKSQGDENDVHCLFNRGICYEKLGKNRDVFYN